MDVGVGITGCGLVTPLGDSLAATWQRMLAGEFIRTHARAALADDGVRPRVTQLALRAAREAIESARWGGDVLRDDRTALLVGTSRGPINEWVSDRAADQIIGLHRVAEELADALRMGLGPRLSYSAACASGLHALIRACLMLRSGEADRALIVGADASLHPLFMQCFKRLGVLPAEGIGCRPFDVSREGFLVSEAAAAVCLEASETSRSRARIAGCILGSDAATITSADPSGDVLRKMLATVIDGRPVDLIHAHGTGTLANDPVELAAIESTIANASKPIVFSHKGALGHSLGASGLISVVLNCEMHARRMVLPNIRTRTPLATKRVRLSSEPIETGIHRSICIAAGFGGPVAAVSLEHAKP